MTWTEHLLEFVSRTSSLIVVLAMLVTGAAVSLGIGLNSADRFLDAREWMRAIGECLRSL
jgi:hypothetical protein